jgi:hypothetical protein
MGRIESTGLTRSQGRFASLNEAQRALVNPDVRSVVFGSCADSLDFRERVGMASSDAHARLDAAATASLAGRLFVVDHATLLDDLDSVVSAMRGSVIRPPFEVTPIFSPGFETGTSCPLFVVTRKAGGLLNLMTAIPVKNDETFFWAVPGFAADCGELVAHFAVALLWTIKARNLKPIGPPR